MRLLLLLFMTSAIPAFAQLPQNFVSGACNPGDTSCQVYPPGNWSAGATIITFSHWTNQRVTVTRVTDPGGDTFVPLTPQINFDGNEAAQFFICMKAKNNSSNSMTWHYSGGVGVYDVVDAFEIRGTNTAKPVDVLLSGTGGSMNMNVGPAPATTFSDEIVLGLWVTDSTGSNPITVGPGYTRIGVDASTIAEYEIVPPKTPATITAKQSNPEPYVGLLLGVVQGTDVPRQGKQ
jgi:hypothetical protein